MQNYIDRLILPLLPPSGPPVVFRTLSGLVVATGYSRVVIGKRGPYIEFDAKHIESSALKIPKDQRWRQMSPIAYYIEHRSLDMLVKVYEQLRTVDYADYRVGCWYISPFDLTSDRWTTLVCPTEKPRAEEEQENSLFDE